MADNQHPAPPLPPSISSPPPSSSLPSRPTITLPPRSSMETIFNAAGGGLAGLGFSPGPMTLVSSFFSDNDECRSFSQLLAGAMASPAAIPSQLHRQSFPAPDELNSTGRDDDFRFKQNRPPGLAIAQPQFFTVPPGMSPASLLDSPGLFSPGQGSFGMTHQQALAQVTAQAAQAHSHLHVQTDHPSSLSTAPTTSSTQLSTFTTNTTAHQQGPSIPDSGVAVNESSDFSHSELRSQPSSFAADKPAEDGYNWRKYGQKQVKGSEFPRSYYKCSHPNCPVKKKVERSLDGQVTEIIYKGQHNHQRPQNNKRAKDTGNPSGNSTIQGNPVLASQVQSGTLNKLKEGIAPCSTSKKDQESSQATPEHLSGTSDSEEVGDAETGVDEKDEDEPDPKRRSTELKVSEPASSHRTVTEPRIIVQTTSEVDLLDDGYRWRKYGQKVVKGNPYPRSYYKCTTPGCNVRKHVERASTDPKAVITTYEGNVGTPAYIAPEVLSKKEYDGKIADVWSCGVTLYVMLVGSYPFEDPEDPSNFRKTLQRILSVHYSIPEYIRISTECRHLLSRIFVANPEKRITIPEIKKHPWFLKDLAVEFMEENESGLHCNNGESESSQSIEEILSIIQEARNPGLGPKVGGNIVGGSMDFDELEADGDTDDMETSGDFVCAL